ncbi:MAG: DUF192 domain-containing protein [Deltaproteobacteria bacterium]|nr:MAG: DUF192 domain-containing protein [Deltaproteobacteria bacterium]
MRLKTHHLWNQWLKIYYSLFLASIFILGCSNDMIIIRKSSGEELQVKVEFARTDEERAKGLMFRQKLPEGQGMLFLFPAESANNFWMKNTPVSLDIIFAHYGKIVDIAPNAQPYSEKLIIPHSLFTEVLEVPAGFSAKHGIQIGDHIVMN